MRYRYRFNVSTLWKKRKEIYEFLNKNNIEYEMWGFDKYGKFGDYEFVKFSLFSTSEDTPRLLKELENLIPFGPMIFPEFTKKEFEQANYLVMRPKRQCIQIKNEEDAFDYACDWIDANGYHRHMHRHQIGTIIISKEPKMDNEVAFWASDDSFSEIYASYKVRELAIEHQLIGIDFKNVLLKNTKKYL